MDKRVDPRPTQANVGSHTARDVAAAELAGIGALAADGWEWSGRWESNPRGRRLRAFKTSGLGRMLAPSVISV